MMSVEEEDRGRYQADVEILDVHLNVLGIHVDDANGGELRHLPRRFRKLYKLNLHLCILSTTVRERERTGGEGEAHRVIELETDGIRCTAKSENQYLIDRVPDNRIDLFLLRQGRQHVAHCS